MSADRSPHKWLIRLLPALLFALFMAGSLLFALFMAGSLLLRFQFGLRAGQRFLDFGEEMIKIVPFAFILIGLFEVWVSKHVVERHFGQQTSTTVGGLYVAFPVAAALQHKGARLAFLFTYIGASGVCRIPMTLFEASFMGIEFTLIRYLVAVPLIILSAELLGSYLQRRAYQIRT